MTNKELILDVLSILEADYRDDNTNPYATIDAVYALTRSDFKATYPEDVIHD